MGKFVCVRVGLCDYMCDHLCVWVCVGGFGSMSVCVRPCASAGVCVCMCVCVIFFLICYTVYITDRARDSAQSLQIPCAGVQDAKIDAGRPQGVIEPPRARLLADDELDLTLYECTCDRVCGVMSRRACMLAYMCVCACVDMFLSVCT